MAQKSTWLPAAGRRPIPWLMVPVSKMRVTCSMQTLCRSLQAEEGPWQAIALPAAWPRLLREREGWPQDGMPVNKCQACWLCASLSAACVAESVWQELAGCWHMRPAHGQRRSCRLGLYIACARPTQIQLGAVRPVDSAGIVGSLRRESFCPAQAASSGRQGRRASS